MAIRTVVTRGYGNGTFNGTIALVVTRGYTVAAQPDTAKYTMNVLANISPALNVTSNISPALNVTSNPTPSKEVESG